MIRVLYHGYGYVWTKDDKIRDEVFEATVGMQHGFFVLGSAYDDCLREFKEARVEILTNYFDIDDYDFSDEFIDVSGIGKIEKTETGLVILNKKHEVSPITVNTKRDIYRKQNGNYLKLYFDESDVVYEGEPAPSEETPPISKYQERYNDFKAWIKSENPPLDKMTKPQIHARLIERNSRLWCISPNTFESFWEKQDLYKASRGRKS
jgi:hypothetical protein